MELIILFLVCAVSIPILAGGAVSAVVMVAAVRSIKSIVDQAERRRREAWAIAAGTFGLKYGRDPRNDLRLEGDVGRTRLVIDTWVDQDQYASFTRIRAGGRLSIRLVIHPETALGKLLGQPDVQVGDPELDDAAQIYGEPPASIRGWMDAETRAAVLRAVREGGELEGGWWTLRCSEQVTDPEELVRLTRILLEAARALDIAHPEDRLGRIAAEDPLPTVRHRALQSLIHRGSPGRWLLDYARDPDDRVAVLAASSLGEEGRGALVERLDRLAPALRRVAALALARLAPGADRPLVERALVSCLADGDAEVIDALGRIGTVGSVPALAPLAEARLGLGPVGQRARAAIRAIQGRLGDVRPGGLALAEPAGGGLSLGDPALPPGDTV